MKGIAHYAIGLAVASCFPETVRQAAAGNPWPMLAGGFFGLLPDLLDFKVIRFLAPRQVQIIPDPLEPDMRMVAEGLALAMREAQKRRKPLTVQLHSMRLGPDKWQPYEIRLVAAGGIEARLLPDATTEGSFLRKQDVETHTPLFVPLDFPLVIGYEARIHVASFEGPTLLLTPLGERGVQVDFLPWHRCWSHSLGLAALSGILAALGGSLRLGLIAFFALAAHVLSDQLGFLGCAVRWPFRRQRDPGFQRFHAHDPFANTAAVWLALLVLFWNLVRSASPPLPISGPRLFFWAGFIPLFLLSLLRRRLLPFPSRRSVVR